ncbi:type II secretion system F family protein [Anaerolentibacter hominis]|uniref:type II secretion system F family protein n=1 Tax=Anaerolentibacter hominis TaxID=3079009 RepID=UPI0031B853F4
MSAKTGKKLSNSELSSFFDQMSVILHAGIPVIEGILLLQEDMGGEGKQILNDIYQVLDETGSFHEALSGTGVFPEYALNLIRIGEQTGRLEEVLASLSSYYQKEEEIRRGVKNALSYPLIMVIMMLGVISVLVIKVMPVFNDVLVQLGSEMTGISRAIMNIGQGLRKYSLAVLLVIIFIAGIILFFTYTKAGKRRGKRLAAGFYPTRRLYEQLELGRFANAMALTLGGGLEMDESLAMAKDLIDSPKLKDKISRCQKEMEDGTGFADALHHSGIFSGLYSRMISVGFRTGYLSAAMEQIAGSAQEESDERIARMISVLEPTLIVVLAVIVGIILLSVILPLMGIMSGMG